MNTKLRAHLTQHIFLYTCTLISMQENVQQRTYLAVSDLLGDGKYQDGYIFIIPASTRTSTRKIRQKTIRFTLHIFVNLGFS